MACEMWCYNSQPYYNNNIYTLICYNYNVSIAFYILKIKSYKGHASVSEARKLCDHAPTKYMIKVMKRRRRVMLLLFYFLSGKWTNRF